MGIKLIKKNESYESDLEDIAQTSGEIDYGDAMALNRAAASDREIRKKVRDLIMDWRSAAEDGDDEEMTKAAKALKTLADSLPKHEARMHLGRKKAEGREGWDNWEEIEGLEDSIDAIENLAYELRNCIRGAKTHCKDWKSLALYIKGLASNLDDAAERMAYKRDDEDESKRNEDKRDLEAIRAKFCDNPELAKIGRLSEPYEGDAVFGTQTWSDGVPITKHWHRDNRSQGVSLKKGTRCIALLDQAGEEVEAVWIPYRNGWLRVDGSGIEVNFN